MRSSQNAKAAATAMTTPIHIAHCTPVLAQSTPPPGQAVVLVTGGRMMSNGMMGAVEVTLLS